MENMDKKQCGDACDCKGSCHNGMCGGFGQMGGCGCHGGRHHHLIKVILKLFIVIIIFWCGFKLGVITGSIQAGYGRQIGNVSGMMRGYNYSNGVLNSGSGTPTP